MRALVISLAPPCERPGARLAYQAAAVVAGSLLVAGLAQISITLPFTPVPITGQTLGVLLVGGALGLELGMASMALYLAEGAAGLPFFAEGRSGLELLGLGSATGGYLWGFVASAAVVGSLTRRGWDRSLRSSIGAMLLGNVVIYAVGVPWLAQALGIPVVDATPFSCRIDTLAGCDAFQLGLYPFVVGDTLKLLAAAALLPGAWRLLGRMDRSA